MNLKTSANIFAIVFLAIGILGFVPGITNDDGLLFGIFRTGPVQNIFYLVSGVAAFVIAMGTGIDAKKYFRILGVVYGLVTVVGFVNNNNVFLFEGNMADNYLYLVISVITLWLGFIDSKKPAMMPPGLTPPSQMGR